MRTTYPITEEQIKVLNSFTCQRLTDDPANLFMIPNFYSNKGNSLVYTLCRHGWNRDKKSTTAYYVIKNPQGRIVMFFSLKCGSLFDPTYVERCKAEFEETKQIREARRLIHTGDQGAAEFLRELRGRLGDAEYLRRMRDLDDDYKDQKDRKYHINWDKRVEPSELIVRSDESHPAVELVEFCANDRTKNTWNTVFEDYSTIRNHTMGQVLFWWFIVPKMIEVSRIVGCEYAYLFAADNEPNGTLVKYYENALHFRKLTHLGTVKPFYDMACYFMGRRLFSVDEDSVDPNEVIRDEDDLRGLDYYRDQFFANFNFRTDVDNII